MQLLSPQTAATEKPSPPLRAWYGHLFNVRQMCAQRGQWSHRRRSENRSAASRPVRRILFGPRSVVAIHLGRRSPDGSSGLPGVVGRAVLPLLGLAPGGACRATRVTPGAGALLPHRFTLTCAPVTRRHRRSALCCAVLRVAPTGGYPAPLPCGVRTFLEPVTLARGHPADSLRQPV